MDARVPMDVVMDSFGVPAVVTRPAPNNDPIETSIAWLPARTDDLLAAGVTVRGRTRVMAFTRAEVPSVRKGTLIDAPEVEDGDVKTWEAESLLDEDEEQIRWIVKQVES